MEFNMKRLMIALLASVMGTCLIACGEQGKKIEATTETTEAAPAAEEAKPAAVVEEAAPAKPAEEAAPAAPATAE
jgi:hypothetical protein